MVYTGTHDNDTTAGWWSSAAEHSVRSAADVQAEQQHARDYLDFEGHDVHWAFIRAVLASVADTATGRPRIARAGSNYGMNRPGTASGNWRWRLLPGQLTDDIANRLALMTELYERDQSPSQMQGTGTLTVSAGGDRSPDQSRVPR